MCIRDSLYIEIRIKPHDIFERDGDDLHCTVPVGLTNAALGGAIEVPTLGGRAEIELPEGTQHGKTFRLRGKGIKGVRSSYPGDLYCHVSVETPIKLTEHQRKLLRELDAKFLIAVAKTGGAIFTGSSSMLAEAIHSDADCANQGLLLWGMREGRRSPDRDHPLGYGKAIYFWSFIVALMLFSMGGLFSIYEGVHKLQATEPVENAWVAIGILAFGIAAESVSLWGCLREVNKDRGRQGLWRWFRSSRQSELLVVFAEDIAALGGLLLALVFISLAHVTGNPAWDAAGSICIGVLLVLVAVLVGVQVKELSLIHISEPTRLLSI